MKFKLRLNKSQTIVVGLIVVILLFVISFYYCFFVAKKAYDQAVSIGSTLGADAGTFVGNAQGSFDGLVYGIPQGSAAGHADGLSAEDTESVISRGFSSQASLQVLIASVKIKTLHKIGREGEAVTDSVILNGLIDLTTDDEPEYAALYTMNGRVVFSVDLSKADIEVTDDNVTILIPSPKAELYTDQESCKRIAEYQGKSGWILFNGSAEDGYDAYLNTFKKTTETVENAVDNYDSLMEQAESAALTQVEEYVKALGAQKKVTVDLLPDEKEAVSDE